MEKRTPHCSLARVHALLAEGLVRITHTAAKGAADLGISEEQLLAGVAQLTRGDFYKSMTSFADHRVWHDVYRPMTRVGRVYLKLVVINDLLIVSFKEL
ncbi:type II toxin-antitoxin system MqsR family toxin [Pseudomonas muyukensis]|uniref:Type II toxin-antitoxin system MqsR family toxin n=1 Tax=Pseudomonas muyukensis TaxID=2842357 RepID=A0ABX8ME55_9PSED|nr:type II toxin-antitoxin system MqsR family toxin [Pseudomonas muyukensis]QXH37356.1 type II toxin-antitoxin system MqsR family toxin [Pseudomonas muyukensis]